MPCKSRSKHICLHLPLEKVRQIHLNRPGWREGRLVDSHQMLEDEDYALLEFILKRTQPWAVTLEYNQREDTDCGANSAPTQDPARGDGK